MKMNNYSGLSDDIKINSHDPRPYGEFLLLSYNIKNWKNHSRDGSWWLTQETLSLDIFQRYGYDLQSGVWFSLISCHRHGWSGVASASLLLAEGFSKNQRQCWPPTAARDLRQGILEWYSKHTATSIYGLPLTSAVVETLTHLEKAISMLFEYAQLLQSRCQTDLRNLLDYLQSNKRTLQKRELLTKVELSEFPVIQSSLSLPIKLRPPYPWKDYFYGGLAGIIFTVVVIYLVCWLYKPSTAISLGQLWPDNRYSLYWERKLTEKTSTLPTTDSWVLINRQLDSLEQRLLDAEQKRKPYMTISELKTSIYQMRATLRDGGEPVQAQLYELQNKINSDQVVSDTEINEIAVHLDALNSRLIQLSGMRESMKKN
ncbi:hypothetical protein Entas_4613 (plasmid) [Enterobacter soli]|uniref:VasL domain-containing protein n=1 Tax=Enterobacter soli TaxID=885040 RepID=UPI000223CFE9|nr:VasL domain-containing protein [Enterobacter soli]AEN67292.1 hypothetical protein Entas_4613 [Enterobacter soli]